LKGAPVPDAVPVILALPDVAGEWNDLLFASYRFYFQLKLNDAVEVIRHHKTFMYGEMLSPSAISPLSDHFP
jgi:hypothetical protein